MRLKYLMASIAFVLLLAPAALWAQEGNASLKNIPDTPATPQLNERSTPVSIDHQGQDNVGTRLVFHLKEIFAKSPLFALSAKDERKVRLVIRSQEEFADRPNTTSLVSLVWLYSENEGTLKYYLDGSVELVHSATVREQAEALASRTHDIAAKYSYLFD